MWKQKIGICVGNYFPGDLCEAVNIIADIGFDAISPVWYPDGSLERIVNTTRERSLLIQSLHAPSRQSAKMWHEDPQIAQGALDELLLSLADCQKFSIPILVVHAWGGFDFSKSPQEKDISHFDILVEKAADAGVQIAFENLQGEQFVYALLDHFKGNDAVGFCWDSGHEVCYSRSMPLLKDLGDRLIMTHINDNLGISSFDGSITSKDDIHLLPFDGVSDWTRNVQLLQQAPKQEILNFEVKPTSRANQHENDNYAQMPLRMYLLEAYKRARKIAYMYAGPYY